MILIIISVGNVYVVSQPVPKGGYLQEMGAILNGCTDEMSQVPEPLVMGESNIEDLMNKRIPISAIIIVIGVIVNVMLALAWGLTACGCCKKEVPATSINRTD